MKLVLISIIVFAFPISLYDQVPEWQSEVVIKADYGYEEDEYGYEGILESKYEDESPVKALYVDDTNIYIYDGFQGKIKIYDLSGKYLRAILTEWKSPSRKMISPQARDLLIHSGSIYFLCQYGGIPPADQSAIFVLTFNLESGEMLERINIYNPDISRENGHSAYTIGATRLKIGPEDGIWIYDIIHDTSFPLVRDSKAVPKGDHKQGIAGEMFGSMRIVYNNEMGRRELVRSDGSFIRDISHGDAKSGKYGLKPGVVGSLSSRNGKFFVIHAPFDSDFIITTWNGRHIGYVKLMEKKPWYTYPINRICQCGPDGRFYWVFADYDGVYLYRWSK